MPTNDFLAWAIGGGANVVSQATYAALSELAGGYVSGTALSNKLNKTWRQSSVMAATLGQFICDLTGSDALDDGNLVTILLNFKLAIRGGAGTYAADSGAADAYACTLAPALSAHVTGMPIKVKIAHDGTGAATFNPGPGVKSIKNLDGSAISSGEIKAGMVAIFIYDGTNYQLINPNNATVAFTGAYSDLTNRPGGPVFVAGSSHTVVAGDYGKTIIFSATGAGTYQLAWPDVTTLVSDFWLRVAVQSTDGDYITVNMTGGQLLDGQTSRRAGVGTDVGIARNGSALQSFEGQWQNRSVYAACSNNHQNVLTHNLGVPGSRISAWAQIKCTSAEFNYSVGDIIPLTSTQPDNANNMCTVINNDNGSGVCNSSQINISNGLRATDKTSFANQGLSLSTKWLMQVVVSVPGGL